MRGGGAKRRQSLHVPMMIAIKINVAFRGEQVKGRELQIVEGLDRPAITAIGIDEAAGERGALAKTIAQRREFWVLRGGLFQSYEGLVKGSAGR